MFPMSADADLDKVMAVGVEKRSRGPQIITKNTDSILRNTVKEGRLIHLRRKRFC